MKGSFSLLFAMVLLAATMFTACGGKDGETASEEKSGLDKLAEAAENMQTAAEEMVETATTEREPQPAVHYKVLMDYLPAAIGDLERGEAEGETASMGEWRYSQAKVEFKGAERASAKVEIFDYAYISMLYASFRMMMKMNYNRESSKGYERTAEIAGYPAMEKWKEAQQDGEITVLVGDRFIVTVHTRQLPEGMTRDILGMMDLKKLAAEKAQPPA